MNADGHIGQRFVSADELAAALERQGQPPAQGGSASAAPLLGLVVSNADCNRYLVQLAEAGSAGGELLPIENATVSAFNAAEPFGQPGQLVEDTVIMLWPVQGDYGFFCPPPATPEDPPDPPSASAASYWARVISGGGPSYIVRRQTAVDDDEFQDADNAEDVSAANCWELAVDPNATAPVPAGAVVRVWEEPDAIQQTRRFFFYPIHTVYR